MNQVSQRFSCVVGLDNLAWMDLQGFARLQYVRRFNQPLSACGGHKQSKDSRIDSDEHRKRMLRRDSDEEVRQFFGKTRFRHHLHDAVQGILDQNSGNRRHGCSNSLNEKTRSPVKKQAGNQEQEDVVIELEYDAGPFVRTSRMR